MGFNHDLGHELLRNYGKIDFDNDAFGVRIGLKILSEDNLVYLERKAKDYMETDGILRL